MNSRTPRLSSKEMIKTLERAGFTVVHTRGSHRKLRGGSRTVIVPLNRDPPRQGTQTDILRQAGIDAELLSTLT
ncbi:MAG: type II toxin-antitoxin system HicA family toxin [Pseudonocardiaceae bacterium]